MLVRWGGEFMNAVLMAEAGSASPLFQPTFSPALVQSTPSADMIGQT
jgi:hypothetical protein